MLCGWFINCPLQTFNVGLSIGWKQTHFSYEPNEEYLIYYYKSEIKLFLKIQLVI